MKLRRFADLRIRYKLLISYSAVFFLSITLGSVVIYSFVRRNIESSIESELKNTTATILKMARASADTSIKNHLRAVAEKNLEIVEYLYAQFQSGALSESAAKDQARAILLSQTIGKTGYIYILDSNGIILIHPKSALHGAVLSEYDFIQDQRARKAGYLEYDWKNPGESQARPKALYMNYFAPGIGSFPSPPTATNSMNWSRWMISGKVFSRCSSVKPVIRMCWTAAAT